MSSRDQLSNLTSAINLSSNLCSNPSQQRSGLRQLFGRSGPDASNCPEKKLDDVSGNPNNTRVFFDIEIDGEAKGRIEFELFAGMTPRTAENFLQLCSREKNGYKGSRFHRVIPGFMCQGGDFTAHNGTGGESIYGATFADEWAAGGWTRHSAPFLLSMANRGPDTNGSQFFITTACTPHLDGRHVVFGRVVKGQEVVSLIERVGTSHGRTRATVAIADCGEIKSKSS